MDSEARKTCATSRTKSMASPTCINRLSVTATSDRFQQVSMLRVLQEVLTNIKFQSMIEHSWIVRRIAANQITSPMIII